MLESRSYGCVSDPMKKTMISFRASILLVLATYPLLLTSTSAAQEVPKAGTASLPSETPAKFVPITSSWNYMRRDVMIPMRDGVKLHTVILVPKGAKSAPILLTRTPYNADRAHQPRRQLSPRARSSTATTTPST